MNPLSLEFFDVISSLLKYLQLTALVLRYGRLRHSGENFNLARQKALEELTEFIPGQRLASQTFSNRPGIITNLIAQLAFLKSSFLRKGGHIHAKSLTYIRIPKSASTSMNQIMLERIYPDLKQKKITAEQVNFLTEVNLQRDLVPDCTLFMVVRNPFSRLVSVYREFFEKGTHYIYQNYLFGILPRQISFEQFVDRISKIPDRLKDQHFRPQNSFLDFYQKKKLEVKTFRLEEPEQLKKFLEQYALQLPHLNKSADEYDFRSYYNARILDRVSQLYAEDIRKFGYENELKSLSEYVKTVH